MPKPFDPDAYLAGEPESSAPPFDPYAYAASQPAGAPPLESTGDPDADAVIAALSAGLPSSPELEFSWADDVECQRRAHSFAELVPDYWATVNGGAWFLPNHVAVYFRISAYGARLAYYLAKHADLFVRICTAKPASSIALLLSLERQLRSLEAPALASAVPLQAVYSSDYAIAPSPEDEQSAAQVLQMLALDIAGAAAN